MPSGKPCRVKHSEGVIDWRIPEKELLELGHHHKGIMRAMWRSWIGLGVGDVGGHDHEKHHAQPTTSSHAPIVVTFRSTGETGMNTASWPLPKRRSAGLGGPALRKSWSGRQDSNLRPLDPQSSALPDCATPRQRHGCNPSPPSSQQHDQARSSFKSSALNATRSSWRPRSRSAASSSLSSSTEAPALRAAPSSPWCSTFRAPAIVNPSA